MKGLGKTGFTNPRASLAPYLENMSKGRWPANVVHDGSAEVVDRFPVATGQSGTVTGREPSTSTRNVLGLYGERAAAVPRGDEGSAARFFYCAKADDDDRIDSKHPTVKPVSLIRWLVRMLAPEGGTVVDPFAGTGTTGAACIRENRRAILIEREAEYHADIERRLARMRGADTPLFQSPQLTLLDGVA
jgi:site-specific DNA-methyltransferase (adenine-specific)